MTSKPTAQEMYDALYGDEDGDLAEIEAIAAFHSGTCDCGSQRCPLCGEDPRN